MNNRLNQLLKPNDGWNGRFLVASTALEGTPFARSIVFVLQQNAEGVFGVIVNRPANEQLKASWSQAINSAGQLPLPHANTVLGHLHEGGLKGGPVIILHPFNTFGEIEVEPGLFLSANSETISKIVNLGDDRYRIYCGITAWSHEQLAKEFDSGLWYPMDADVLDVLAGEEILWERAILQYGRSIMCDILGVSELHGNPLWN